MNSITHKLLKEHFGYDHFRHGQEEIINHILKGKDCLGIMPTGAGKSICYQIPATLLSGITIVISPLISLMKDQVDSLNQSGIAATYLNSSLSQVDFLQTIQNIQFGMYKIIYVAPERLLSDSFSHILSTMEISMIAIDEAHCVSQWGHDFRPSYREIANLVLTLPKRPIVAAFTATATQLVKEDIIHLLHLQNPFVLTTGFDRKNLYFSVQSPEDKEQYLFSFLEQHPHTSGIIYCSTRKTVDNLFETLSQHSYLVSKYHAGMSEKARNSSQDQFVYDQTDIMIATNAFGMGIDKSNVRYVIHYNMPRDLESYYQEAGRAGRDGDNAECTLLFSRADVVMQKFLIEQSSDTNHANEYQKLNEMIAYCHTDKCLRRYILEYFGETPNFENCHFCSNCNSKMETTDITLASKKILSCIKRMKERYGAGLVTDVLKGSKNAKIKQLGFDTLSTYGILNEYSRDTIRDMISFLVAEGFVQSTGDQYPVLSLTGQANSVLFGDTSIFMKRKLEKASRENHSQNSSFEDLAFDQVLFDQLRNLRKYLSLKENVPPFVIFTDLSLKQMATYFPITKDDMLSIDGVGEFRFKKYGEIFLSSIKKYVTETQKQSIPLSSHSLKKSSKRGDTKLVSYQLYTQDNKSITEIAHIRGLSVTTIENHLLQCFEDGMAIDLTKEVQWKEKEIVDHVIRSCSSDKLKPIKDALPKEVSYFDIRYYKILFKKEKNQ